MSGFNPNPLITVSSGKGIRLPPDELVRDVTVDFVHPSVSVKEKVARKIFYRMAVPQEMEGYEKQPAVLVIATVGGLQTADDAARLSTVLNHDIRMRGALGEYRLVCASVSKTQEFAAIVATYPKGDRLPQQKVFDIAAAILSKYTTFFLEGSDPDVCALVGYMHDTVTYAYDVVSYDGNDVMSMVRCSTFYRYYITTLAGTRLPTVLPGHEQFIRGAYPDEALPLYLKCYAVACACNHDLTRIVHFNTVPCAVFKLSGARMNTQIARVYDLMSEWPSCVGTYCEVLGAPNAFTLVDEYSLHSVSTYEGETLHRISSCQLRDLAAADAAACPACTPAIPLTGSRMLDGSMSTSSLAAGGLATGSVITLRGAHPEPDTRSAAGLAAGPVAGAQGLFRLDTPPLTGSTPLAHLGEGDAGAMVIAQTSNQDTRHMLCDVYILTNRALGVSGGDVTKKLVRPSILSLPRSQKRVAPITPVNPTDLQEVLLNVSGMCDETAGAIVESVLQRAQCFDVRIDLYTASASFLSARRDVPDLVARLAAEGFSSRVVSRDCGQSEYRTGISNTRNFRVMLGRFCGHLAFTITILLLLGSKRFAGVGADAGGQAPDSGFYRPLNGSSCTPCDTLVMVLAALQIFALGVPILKTFAQALRSRLFGHDVVITLACLLAFAASVALYGAALGARLGGEVRFWFDTASILYTLLSFNRLVELCMRQLSMKHLIEKANLVPEDATAITNVFMPDVVQVYLTSGESLLHDAGAGVGAAGAAGATGAVGGDVQTPHFTDLSVLPVDSVDGQLAQGRGAPAMREASPGFFPGPSPGPSPDSSLESPHHGTLDAAALGMAPAHLQGRQQGSPQGAPARGSVDGAPCAGAGAGADRPPVDPLLNILEGKYRFSAIIHHLTVAFSDEFADHCFANTITRALIPGCVVRVFAGSRCPCDGLIIHGSALVDDRHVTGGLAPQSRRSLGDRICAGTHVLTSELYVCCAAVGRATAIEKMLNIIHKTQQGPAPCLGLHERLRRAGAGIRYASLALALTVLCVWLFVAYLNVLDFADLVRLLGGRDDRDNNRPTLRFYFCFSLCLSVLVVGCASSLDAALPAVARAATAQGARLGLVLRGTMHVCTRLRRATCFVFSKAGVFTLGTPIIEDLTVPLNVDEMLAFLEANGRIEQVAASTLAPAPAPAGAGAGVDAEAVPGGVPGGTPERRYRVHVPDACGATPGALHGCGSTSVLSGAGQDILHSELSGHPQGARGALKGKSAPRQRDGSRGSQDTGAPPRSVPRTKDRMPLMLEPESSSSTQDLDPVGLGEAPDRAVDGADSVDSAGGTLGLAICRLPFLQRGGPVDAGAGAAARAPGSMTGVKHVGFVREQDARVLSSKPLEGISILPAHAAPPGGQASFEGPPPGLAAGAPAPLETAGAGLAGRAGRADGGRPPYLQRGAPPSGGGPDRTYTRDELLQAMNTGGPLMELRNLFFGFITIRVLQMYAAMAHKTDNTITNDLLASIIALLTGRPIKNYATNYTSVEAFSLPEIRDVHTDSKGGVTARVERHDVYFGPVGKNYAAGVDRQTLQAANLPTQPYVCINPHTFAYHTTTYAELVGGAPGCAPGCAAAEAAEAAEAKDQPSQRVAMYIGDVLVSVLRTSDYVRPEAAATIAFLKRRGCKVFLLTSDFRCVAYKLADSVGIPRENVMAECAVSEKPRVLRYIDATGTVPPAMSKTFSLPTPAPAPCWGRRAGRRPQGLFARSPRDPLGAPEMRNTVFVCDGVTDLPCLSACSLSVAVTSTEEPVRAATDAALTSNSLGELCTLYRFAGVVHAFLCATIALSMLYICVALPISFGILVPARAFFDPLYAAVATSAVSLLVVVFPFLITAARIRKGVSGHHVN